MTTSDSTTRATDDIRLVDGPDDALAARLDEELAEFNFEATGIRDAREFAAALHDDRGARTAWRAGVDVGATCWVERLWVREDTRHRGLGRRLLMAVESEARARGCGQLALTTHSFQAPGFYRRLGFDSVGELADYPVGHASLLLRKRLRSSS
jgi:GNAT superfamily N-acetyltransferase